MASNKRHFKMWARYSGDNQLIPGSNIWAKKAPPVGNWVEIQAYECCNPTTTTTTTQGAEPGPPPCMTYQAIVSRGVAVVIYADCDGEYQFLECYPGITEFCALLAQYITLGQVGVFEVGEGCTITTTTTHIPVPSDINLKEEITATGGKIGEFNEYTWNWNSTAKSLGFDSYPNRGVLAQEVHVLKPEAIVYNMGYMMVRYDLIN